MSTLRYLWQHPWLLLLIYLILINLALFLTMAADKSRARREKRRVPEMTLFLLALIGGSVGGIAGMYTFRHKTKHLSFTVGFPLILALQLALAAYVIFR